LALIIRLSRSGRVHLPFYHIGVFDSRTRRDGRPVEDLGLYDPLSKKEQVRLNLERAKYWLSQGAKPSLTLASILKRQGLTSDLWIHKKKKVGKPKVRNAAKKIAADKARKVQKRKKARTAKSANRGKKPAAAAAAPAS
jgi:small subunit ribosomal protein S16